MSTDACATPGCGHPTTSHSFGYGDCGRLVAKGSGTTCPCTAYLPPRPVPEEASGCACGDPRPHGPHEFALQDATVPAPHAEAEAAWSDWSDIEADGYDGNERRAFIAGYLRGRGDRG